MSDRMNENMFDDDDIDQTECPECGGSYDNHADGCSLDVNAEGPDANDARHDMRKENPRNEADGPVMTMMKNAPDGEEVEDSFLHHGTNITNPFWDESGRFEVNPEEEYGEDFTNSAMAKRLHWGEGKEAVGFDKYMDKILVQEGHNRKPTKQEDSPQRRRQAARQERPMGRVRFGGK